MNRSRLALVMVLLIVFQVGSAASTRYMGYFFVTFWDGDEVQDFSGQVQGNSNIINWEFDVRTLPAIESRINQQPKMKLMVTLPLSSSSDPTLGINKAVFLNTSGARDTYLEHVKSELQSTSPSVYDSVAYIAVWEEWHTLMYQGHFGPGGLNWQLFDGTDPWVKRDDMVDYLEAFIDDVKDVFPNIPVVMIEGWWSTDQYNLSHPPSNADVLALDAYLLATSTACDTTQRARFDDQVTPAYAEAATIGKPLMMVGNTAPLGSFPIPSACQLQWFKDLADTYNIQTIFWWLYAHPVSGGTGLKDTTTEKALLFSMGDAIIDGNLIGSLDTPAPEATVGPGTQVGGWAIDRAALLNQLTGIYTIHAWGYPDGGGPPVFLGVDYPAGSRSDVVSALGPDEAGKPQTHFQNCGFNFLLPSNTPIGGFTMVVSAQSTETGLFTPIASRHLVR